MAKPDLDDGWFKVAYELLPPLMMCCQRVEASIVLCEVLAQTYGRGKRETAKLCPARIAKDTGRLRPHIWRGIKELTDKGILERLGDGTFRFEKDYEKWKTPDGSLVPAQLASYFAKFPKHVKACEPDSDPELSVPYQGTISKKPNTKRVPYRGTVPGDPEPATVPYQGTPSVPPEGTVRVPYRGTDVVPPPITPPSRCENYENGESSSKARDARIIDDDHEKTVERARAAYGDPFAEVVIDRGLDISRSTGGRWDCFCAAIDAAKRSRRVIGDLYLWCLRTSQQFAATGIPPAPISVSPSAPESSSPPCPAPITERERKRQELKAGLAELAAEAKARAAARAESERGNP